ncbi:MAG TPA: MlaD family protein [Baekduia sp.]|nr:MlaD family protein [Baekduia sp.]
MNVRRIVPSILGAALVAVCVVVLLGDDGDKYRVRLEMSNAAGVRDGTRVTIAGSPVGRVESLSLGPRDIVQADIELDDGHRIGAGARAEVKATNLLATKFVDLQPGDVSRPAPSGTVIPNARVKKSVEVDELIDVLDADTRTRLGILVNEAGLAVTGRKADFNKLVGRLPATLDDATDLLRDLSADTAALGRLIESSDRVLVRLDPERRRIGELLGSAGETMRTVSAKRAELRATLARAPRSLDSLRGVLAELRRTAAPLGPAARALSATAPALAGTLEQLKPFERSARPTLEAAKEAAPSLTRLGKEATPVLGRSLPALSSLETFSDELAPITKVLARGGTGAVRKRRSPGAIDDLLGTATSWASGASDRDAAGHIFHGIVTIGGDTLLSAVKTYAEILKDPADRQRRKKQRAGRRLPVLPERRRDPRTPPPANKVLPKLLPKVPAGEQVQEVVDGTTGLLDFLFKP